ncbi:MAG TPA: glycerate kinase [Candidatus Dormibacteraeota bacterium]
MPPQPTPAGRILLAPDSFKGTFSAVEVVDALASGFPAAGLEVDRCPVADGGEGTSETLRAALGGETVEVDVHDPLGRPIRANFKLLADGETAIVDTAAASGMDLLSAEELDAEAATTTGTGELIAAAAQRAKRIWLGVGGSATTDGGRGAIEALTAAGGLGDVQLVCLCDVRIPWEEAAEEFAPQKGADAATVKRLSERLDQLAADAPRDPRGVPMTGAAGGLAGGLWAWCGADLVAGAPFVLEAVDFDLRARQAVAVVTGEGRLDATTMEGKIVAELAGRANRIGVPVHAIVGEDVTDADQKRELGLASVREATTLAEITAAARRTAASYGMT